jgi:hypothetical protein
MNFIMLSAFRTAPTPLQVMYAAAKAKQIDPIKDALKLVAINADSGANGTLVSVLAAEGDFDSIKFLRENFGADVRGAIYGLGYTKQMKPAQVILDEAIIYEEWFDLLSYLLKGLAVAGYTDEINVIFDKLSGHEKQRLTPYIVMGFAAGDKIAAADQWLSSKGLEIDTTDNVTAKIAGLVQSGKIEEAKQILDKELIGVGQDLMPLDRFGDDLNINNFPKANPLVIKAQVSMSQYKHYKNYFVYNIARIGQLPLALKEFCVEQGNANPINTLHFWAVEGAGRGGYHADALQFIATVKDKATRINLTTSLLGGLARGGASTAIMQIAPEFIKANLNTETAQLNTQKTIVEKFAIAGYFTLAMDFIGNYPEQRQVLTHHLLTRLDVKGNLSKEAYKKTITAASQTFLAANTTPPVSSVFALRLPAEFVKLATAGDAQSGINRYSFQAVSFNSSDANTASASTAVTTYQPAKPKM